MNRFKDFFLIATLALVLFALSPFVQAAGTCCSPFPGNQTQQLVLNAPTYTQAVVLVANTAQSTTVPAGANFAVFSADCNFFIDGTGNTAAVPGATTTDGSASVQNPTAWKLLGARSLSVVAATACKLTVSYYQ